MGDVTLITPTRNRPIPLKLCVKWMAAQDFKGTIDWLIVDDGNGSPANLKLDNRFKIRVIKRKPEKGERGPRSLAANLMHALIRVKTDKIIMIEDDDYYWPNHVTDMAARLNRAQIAGPIWQKYYNVPNRMNLVQKNIGSSLCSTGFRRELIPLLQSSCRKCYKWNSRGIDRTFWDRCGRTRRDLFNTKTQTCIGIKGLPGERGIGHGHAPISKSHKWTYKQDRSGKVLEQWVGKNAARIYFDVFKKENR